MYNLKWHNMDTSYIYVNSVMFLGGNTHENKFDIYFM